MSQFGAAGRDNYNVAGNVHITNTGGQTPVQSTESEETTGTGGGGGWIVFIVVVVLLIYGGSHLGNSASSEAVQFPAKSAPWPEYSTAQLAELPVVNWLESCANEMVLSPINCPQSVSSNGNAVSNVHWVLHGNPSDGAQIRYSNGKFWVLGHAVMTVTYTDSAEGNQWQMDTFGYEATISWNTNHPALDSLKSVSLNGGASVTERDPHLSWSLVSAAVLTGFKQCAAYIITPLPEQCMSIGDYGDHATWRLIDNPLLNARQHFDPATGLIHVTGSYVMTDSYLLQFIGSRENDYLSGNYDAVLSLDGGRISLLQIAKS
jgi:hypothetical protein